MQERIYKAFQIGKEEEKLFPFANAMILYIELFTREALLELIARQESKIDRPNQGYFYTLARNKLKINWEQFYLE